MSRFADFYVSSDLNEQALKKKRKEELLMIGELLVEIVVADFMLGCLQPISKRSIYVLLL